MEIKASCRQDKKTYIKEKCQKIESQQVCNNSLERSKEINSMTKEFQLQLRVVKDKYGTILTGMGKLNYDGKNIVRILQNF